MKQIFVFGTEGEKLDFLFARQLADSDSDGHRIALQVLLIKNRAIDHRQPLGILLRNFQRW